MKKNKFYILLLAISHILISCKSSYTAINDKTIGIVFNMPKGADSINPETLVNKYSYKFYWGNGTDGITKNYPHKPNMDYTYQINKDVIIGFICLEDPYPFKNAEEDRNQFIRSVRYNTTKIVQKVEEEYINGRLFQLCFYKEPQNNEDCFVSFGSDGTKVNRIGGEIRFPASYPLEEIEKQTTKILSGIKFQF
ncbi:hypothetical protein [Viscerimonas tarda]